MRCNNKATWSIVFGGGPDDFTDSCSQHLGEMAEGCVISAAKNQCSIQLHDVGGEAKCCRMGSAVDSNPFLVAAKYLQATPAVPDSADWTRGWLSAIEQLLWKSRNLGYDV